MKFTTLIAAAVACLSLSVLGAQDAKKHIIKEVNICKRNDPQLEKCYCTNFNKLVPRITHGVPEMNLMEIDPVPMDHIRFELPETEVVKFRAELSNVTVHGFGSGRAALCRAYMTEDGLQLELQLVFQGIQLTSKYKGDGKFMLLSLQTSGDFYANSTGMEVRGLWNSTRFMKLGKEHLIFTNKAIDMKMGKTQVRFTNILGNDTEINERFNELINENMDLLYEEIKPIVLETFKLLSLKLVDGLYDAFPFDVLFPKN